MVLESLITPFKAKKRPWELFILGFVYATAGLFLGNWIFKEYASLIMVFLTVMACLPLLYGTLKEEEEIDINLKEEKSILKEHSKVVFFFMFLFLGLITAYTLWYIVLPATLVQSTFSVQTTTIQSINAKIAGSYAAATRTLTVILLNNIKVLIFCILFSFLYGAGAIFILTWNASVISAAIGNLIRSNLSIYASTAGFTKLTAYFQVISLGLLRYLVHGIPEIIAYFIAAIAGGLISVAVIKEKFGTKNFEKIVLDSANLILIAIGVLVIAAIMEVFLIPIFF